MLTGSYDNTAILWDATTGERIESFEGHAGEVRSVAFSADGKHAIVHLSHAWAPHTSTGTWYLLTMRDGDWRVFRTAKSDKHGR